MSLYPASPLALVKLGEVWRELRGPPSARFIDTDRSADVAANATPKPGHWQPFILGLAKHALLRSLRPIVAANPALATLAPFAEEE